MSNVLKEVLAANEKYAADFGDKGNLPIPPGRHFAIVTCMDARLDPAKFAGLAEGDAHVIRNAGGRVNDETIRSLIISHKLLGTQEWFVIHHTDCGMLTFTNPVIHNLLHESLDTAALGPSGMVQPGQGWWRRCDPHRLPPNRQPRTERGGRREEDPREPTGSKVHPNLRLCLRRQVRTVDRGARGHGGGSRRRQVGASNLRPAVRSPALVANVEARGSFHEMPWKAARPDGPDRLRGRAGSPPPPPGMADF